MSQSAQRGHVNARYATRGANRGEGRERGGGGWLSRKILDEWKPTAAVINGGNHNCIARFENKKLFAAMKLYLEKNPSAYKFLFNFETNATKRTTISFFLEKLLEIIDTRKDVESIF